MPLTHISNIYAALFSPTYLVRDNELNNLHKARQDYYDGARFEPQADILTCVFTISRL